MELFLFVAWGMFTMPKGKNYRYYEPVYNHGHGWVFYMPAVHGSRVSKEKYGTDVCVGTFSNEEDAWEHARLSKIRNDHFHDNRVIRCIRGQ